MIQIYVRIDAIMARYDEIFRLKGVAAKTDVFHIFFGMWKTPAERCLQNNYFKITVHQLANQIHTAHDSYI
jgi:Seed dormancy control